VSIYHVRISPDRMVEMTLANVHPRAEQALTWEQEVAMEWAPSSGVVLTD
jgi:putrescine transport system ATP-binding protein